MENSINILRKVIIAIVVGFIAFTLFMVAKEAFSDLTLLNRAF